MSAGANVKAVQRMLGHAKALMTLDGDLGNGSHRRRHWRLPLGLPLCCLPQCRDGAQAY
jgi:hypothetical protein